MKLFCSAPKTSLVKEFLKNSPSSLRYGHFSGFSKKAKNTGAFFGGNVSRGTNITGLVRSWAPNEVPISSRDQYLGRKKKFPKPNIQFGALRWIAKVAPKVAEPDPGGGVPPPEFFGR